ncbi:hypothetical protein JTE90_014126 [Oedothorax gibbosus]|uniref:FLYWCH-type domain-containing protein n=1 Tax=Oedothorax gibbosus TaxID=931172 RepID=A0AAV6U3U4_9ARAC|nr:hypothetical protein JTE90_014126 [Oedothorax gibbosus]
MEPIPSPQEILSTKKGKPCLILDGYKYRIHRTTKCYIRWTCTEEKKSKCKGSVTTNLNHQVLRQVIHSCIPNPAAIDVKRKLAVVQKKST